MKTRETEPVIITEKHKSDAQVINMINNAMYNVYRATLNWEQFGDIVSTTKSKGVNKGQYGYYGWVSPGSVYLSMLKYRCKSLLDLGSGAGILMAAIKSVAPYEWKLAGYEIEQKLINQAKKICPWGKHLNKDILTLTTKDIEKYDMIYFWEPFVDSQLSKRFVENLSAIIPPGKYIHYVSAGNIGTHLRTCKNIVELRDGEMSGMYKSI